MTPNRPLPTRSQPAPVRAPQAARPVAALPRLAPQNTALAADTVDLALSRIEASISTLREALVAREAVAVESASEELRATLRGAMETFARARRAGRLPAALRHRLAATRGQIVALGTAVRQASLAIEQKLDVMMPKPPAAASVYAMPGRIGRSTGYVIASS